MAGNCGICGEPCEVGSESVKCVGLCSLHFHMKCIPGDMLTRATKKEFVCESCKNKKSASSLSSSKSSPGTTLTKEFLITMMEAFKSEVFKELKSYNKEFSEFKESLSFFSDKIDETKKLLEETNKNYKEMKQEVEDLRQKNMELTQEMKVLQVRMKNIEQYSRKNNIEISGIPTSNNEDVIAVVEDIGKAIGVTLRREDVAAAHRVPSFQAGRTPSLIVQFSTRVVRDQWITKAKERKDLTADSVNHNFPRRRVFIGEHLTPETKVLLSRTKDKCKATGWKYAWCREGKVYVRKADGLKCVRIDSPCDLAKLE